MICGTYDKYGRPDNRFSLTVCNFPVYGPALRIRLRGASQPHCCNHNGHSHSFKELFQHN